MRELVKFSSPMTMMIVSGCEERERERYNIYL